MPAPPASNPASTKVKAGILLFVLCCLLSTIRIHRDAPNPLHIKPDHISQRSDRRFAALKAQLPANGVVGYVGETGDSATPDYYLTQYALAPLVVDRSINHPMIVGNFPSSQLADIPQNLRILQDFGNGVLLFAHQDAN